MELSRRGAGRAELGFTTGRNPADCYVAFVGVNIGLFVGSFIDD